VQVLALAAEQPDLTLVDAVAGLRRRRIRTSRSSLWRFLIRHDFTLKKACKRRSGSEQTSPARTADQHGLDDFSRDCAGGHARGGFAGGPAAAPRWSRIPYFAS
jgi:hypothetical protein